MKKRYTFAEELTNAITHGVGAVWGLVALTLLITLAALFGDARHVVSFSIYGTTLVIMYTMSTLYHSFTNQRVKDIFQILDHSSIYLLIAGTYTPLTLITLGGSLGITLLCAVWTMAVIGIFLNARFPKRFKVLSLSCYLLMGWAVVVAIKPLVLSLGKGGTAWLIAGGIFYSVGAIFYVMKNLKFHHGVWHLFVIAGSVAHFVVVIRYVL